MKPLLVAAAAVLVVTGCASTPAAEPAPSSSTSASQSESAGTLAIQDVQFLSMMIPHHEQAVKMAKMVPDRTINPDVQRLAQAILSAQSDEIALMTGLLQADGYGDLVDAHAGHAMDGMLTADEMAALETANGTQFDRLWLEGMIAHHEGALVMAQPVVTSTNPVVAAFARQVVEVQTAEIAEMETLLASLPQ